MLRKYLNIKSLFDSANVRYTPNVKYISNNTGMDHDLFSLVYENNIHCLIYNNFLNNAEINTIRKTLHSSFKHHLNLVSSKYIYNKEIGFTLGETIVDVTNLENYKQNAIYFINNESKIVGLNVVKLLINFFKAISVSKDISIAKIDNVNFCFPYSIRNFKTNSKGIFNHIDYFIHTNKDEFKSINDTLDSKTILSFFIMIQKPYKGGELKLYDSFYSDLPAYLKDLYHTKYNKIDNFVNNLSSAYIKLNEGDLILFDAGQQWHKIEPIIGNADRITLGGFCGLSKNKDRIFIWS